MLLLRPRKLQRLRLRSKRPTGSQWRQGRRWRSPAGGCRSCRWRCSSSGCRWRARLNGGWHSAARRCSTGSTVCCEKGSAGGSGGSQPRGFSPAIAAHRLPWRRHLVAAMSRWWTGWQGGAQVSHGLAVVGAAGSADAEAEEEEDARPRRGPRWRGDRACYE